MLTAIEVASSERSPSPRSRPSRGASRAAAVGLVALGVAASVAVEIAHRSLADGCGAFVERMTGEAALEIRGGLEGLPEDLLATVREVAGVAAALGSVRGFVPIAGESEDPVYVLGVELPADGVVRDYKIDAKETSPADLVRLFTEDDAVALTADFLKKTGRRPGERIRLEGPGGAAELTIRATLDLDVGPAGLFGGRVAVVRLPTAQRLLAMPDRLAQIDVALQPRASVAEVETALERRLPAGVATDRPRKRSRMILRALGTARVALLVVGVGMALAGLYRIFVSVELSALEARLPSDALPLRRIFVEFVGLAAIACAAGLLIGWPLTRALSNTWEAGAAALTRFP